MVSIEDHGTVHPITCYGWWGGPEFDAELDAVAVPLEGYPALPREAVPSHAASPNLDERAEPPPKRVP